MNKYTKIHKKKNCEWEMFLFFYLPTARPDRSAARQPMLQSFPRAPWLPRNHAPPVRGAAKQPLLQTIPGPTLEVAFRVSIGCKCKTRTKVFPGKWKKMWRGFFESPTHVLLPVGLSLSERCYNCSLKILHIKGTARLLLGELLDSPCYKQSQAPLKSGLPYLCKSLDFQNL